MIRQELFACRRNPGRDIGHGIAASDSRYLKLGRIYAIVANDVQLPLAIINPGTLPGRLAMTILCILYTVRNNNKEAPF